ncbi:phage integrase N-terminal domain-containing protein [Humidesulfovibrio sp.]
MAGKQDPLLFALGKARLTGSRKTQYNHRLEARRFVKLLRELGNGVAKWANITNKHVAAVVARWRADGLSPGTIKNNLAGVRTVCAAYGNDAIASSNSAFGIGRRAYISNVNRAVADVEYERVTGSLRASDNPEYSRVALMLGLQREFGMRLEESMKFNPFRDTDGNLAHIHVGTKGGRPRWIVIRTEGQRALLGTARASGFYRDLRHGLIPGHCREEQWRGFVYRTIRQASIDTGGTGLRMHGLRHAYAHKRYAELTGFLPPCRFSARDEFYAAAEKAAGPAWREHDERARCTIREELGHSPDRVDIDAQYLGKR